MVVVAAKVAASLDVGDVGGHGGCGCSVLAAGDAGFGVVGLSLILLWFRPWFWSFFACLSVSKSLEI